MATSYSKFHPIAFGLSCAIIAGFATLLMGLSANMFLNGKPVVAMFGSMYITYNPSLLNSAIGALVAAVNGLVGGYVISWLYNLLTDYI